MSPSAPVEPAVSTPEREAVLAEFLRDGSAPEVLAENHEVPVHRIRKWMESEKWPELRSKFAVTLYASSQDDLMRFIADNRLPLITEQLAVARKLQERILEVVDNISIDDDPKGSSFLIERMSRALASISATTGKLVAVSDKPFDSGEGGSGGGGRQPLIMIGMHPKDVEVTEVKPT